MLSRIVNLLSSHGYHSIGALTNEEAINIFGEADIQGVIIGGGVDAESRMLFHSTFRQKNPHVKIIDAHPQSVLEDLKVAFPDS